MAKNKNQHLVPESYLNAWCDPETQKGQEPYVWVFQKDGSGAKRKAPGNLFSETDTYTIKGPSGERDLRLETGLSKLEGKFAKVRREKLEKGVPLSDDDVKVLRMFTAAMMARTASQRKHVKGEWGRVLAMGERLEQAASRGAIPPQPAPGEGATFTLAEVRRIVAQPLQTTLVPNSEAFYSIFRQLNMVIFETDAEPGFITSDAPCYANAPELSTRPMTIYDSVLHLPSTEVHLPLSPRFLLYLSRNDLHGRVKVPVDFVEEINRRTRFSCDQKFVVNRNHLSPAWFFQKDVVAGSAR